MLSPTFDSVPTPTLQKRKRFTDLALYAVWSGGAIGMLAACSQRFQAGQVEMTTLVVSLVALLVSVPVYREREQIEAILEERGTDS